MDKWIQELGVLFKVVWCESQVAYSCFITGFKHKPFYIVRTIQMLQNNLNNLMTL